MKQIKKYLKIIIGCLIIAITLNTIFINLDLVPSSIFGFSILYCKHTTMSLELTTFLLNAFFIVLGYLTLEKEDLKKAILPFFLIPLFIGLTNNIDILIDLSHIDTFLVAIYGGAFMGIGYQLIYKENNLVSASDIIVLITKKIFYRGHYIVNYILDFMWLIFAGFSYGLEGAMYSLITIIIMEILSKRANLGISDSKVFYIITKKDREVRKYIIDELHYELTMFDVKGGFLEKKNKVLMSVIPTKDYYRLKEGIKMIDPHAFISITDSYEVIKNKN